MKQVIAVALLLVSSTEAISKKVRHQGAFEQSLISMGMSSSSGSSAEDVEEDDDYQAVQVRGIEEKKDDFHGYHPWYDGFEGSTHMNVEWRSPYERKVPEVFSGEERDSFTSKMIAEFALEGHNEETGKPNGKFTLNKDQAKEATYEVMKTHLGFDKAAADAHNAEYFDKVWEHMDVNKTGRLEAVEM